MPILNPLEYPVCFSRPLRLDSVSTWVEHIPFGMLMVDILRPKILVELGTHTGVSYSGFCQAVKQLRLDTQCYAVDTWVGDIQTGFYGPDIFANLLSYHNPLYGEFSRLIQSTFDEAVKYFSDDSIDLLHIDGLHTYEAVKHDFETWLPKLSQRAVVLFHDTNVRERDFGVWKLWEELQRKYPRFEFLHGDGLGVVYIGEKPFDSLEQLFSASENETRQIREFFFLLGSRFSAEIEKENQIQNLSHQLTEKNRAAQALIVPINEQEQATQMPSTQISDKSQAEAVSPEFDQEEYVALIRSSDLFDRAWYLDNNPDVRQAQMDPALHYLLFGGFEARDPSHLFNTSYYLAIYPDVKKSGINPLIHYLKHGKSEGRKAQPDPIIVHQMGKVGSKTIELSLIKAYETLGINMPIYHTHVLHGFDLRKRLAFQEEKQGKRTSASTLAALEYGENIRKQIDKNPAQHWNIVSLVRDPVGRNIATFFENLSEYIPDWRERYNDGKLSVNEIQALFVSMASTYRELDKWFDRQMKSVPAFSIDVYKTPFPREIGYTIYPGALQASLLLIRQENLNECAERAMHEFLGLKNFALHNTNIADKKDYADLYRAFKEHPLPVKYVQKIYNTQIARHFYTDVELLGFAKRWTGTDTLELTKLTKDS